MEALEKKKLAGYWRYTKLNVVEIFLVIGSFLLALIFFVIGVRAQLSFVNVSGKIYFSLTAIAMLFGIFFLAVFEVMKYYLDKKKVD